MIGSFFGSRVLLLAAAVFCSLPLRAAQFGDFSYELINSDTEVAITDYPEDATGGVVIPVEIEGLPVTSIGFGAFGRCAGITGVSIPEGVTSLGVSAFLGCASLAEIQLPTTVSSIGGHAFSGCASLASIQIPSGVGNLASSAFNGCTALLSIDVDPLNASFRSLDGVVFNTSLTTLVRVPPGFSGPYAIPDGVTSIARGSLQDCQYLTGISFPPSVRSIAASAFQGCSGLSELVINSGLTAIHREAFKDCNGLLSVSLPSTLRDIEWDVFEGCTRVEAYTMPNGGSGHVSAIDGVLHRVGISGRIYTVLRYPAGRVGPYVIPEGIEEIEDRAFSDSADLSGIVLPESLTGIGLEAFRGCSGLGEVDFPQSVTRIDLLAFLWCHGLTDVYVPETVLFLGAGAFAACNGLLSINVSPQNPNYMSLDGVLYTKDGALLQQFPAGRGGFFSVPVGVARIAGFTGCSRITKVEMPSTVSSLVASAFQGCSSLESVNIPDGIVRIDYDTFYGCSSLQSIVLPQSVTRVDSYAFEQCPNLRSVVFLGDAPSVSSSAFPDVDPSFTFYYLTGSSGFTSPTWNGYTAIEFDAVGYPAGPWLLEQGLGYDVDLHQDLNGDGVSLFMAYALDLDLGGNLAGSLPRAEIIDPDTVGLTFHGVSPGVSYSVWKSDDMTSWTTDGVTVSEPDAFGRRTAMMERSSPRGFLQLVVED